MEKKLQKTKVEEWLDNPKRVLVGGLVVGISAFVLYKLGRRIITRIRSKNTSLKADEDLETQQAMLLRNAMNPSGISWMMSFDTTNTDAVLEVAKKITNFDKVAKTYKKLYDADLTADLQSELNTEEYQKFLTLITANATVTTTNSDGSTTTTTSPLATYATKGQMIVAKKEVFLRSSADASFHYGFFESGSNNNIIGKASPGEFIGYATGKQEFDVENNVKFIQVGYVIVKENLPSLYKSYAGKKYTFWVSSSSNYVDKFDYFKQMFDKYPTTAVIIKYKKPLDYYDSDVKGVGNRLVVSVKDMHVLNEKMQPYVSVEKETLLGEYIGELTTARTRFVKFRTVDNTERWADASTIKIIER